MSNARAAVDRSFEQLYRGHHADVFRAALRELGNVHDAEDVTQAAFVDAYRAVLRGSRPEAPRAWLLAIAENVRRRRFRSAQRRPREEPLDADFPLAPEPHELAHALAEALAALPPEQRRVFVLRELAGLSYEEIAGETGSTVGSIQMLLFRARSSLRERLEPPTVGRRRAGFLLPLPGWLTGLVSRAEVAALTPRVAGAVGATVAAVAASVAVNDVQADGTGQGRPMVEPRPALAAKARPGSPARASARVARAARATPAGVVRRRPAATTRAPTEARPTQTPVVPAPSAEPPSPAEAAPAPAPKTSTTVETRSTVAVEPPPLPVPVAEQVEVVEVVERALDVPPPVATALTDAAGAAGAAGAGAPPLPVSGVPPVALPPAP